METITIRKRHINDMGGSGSYDTYKEEILLRDDGGIEHVKVHNFWDNKTRQASEITRFGRAIGEREARRLIDEAWAAGTIRSPHPDVRADFEAWNAARRQRIAIAL